MCFFVLRGGLNSYGDPTPWTYQPDPGRTVLSFFNVEKYPSSLDFLCLTLGISLVLLGTLEGADLEHWKPVTVFGKVALFYYVAHIYMIHLLAVATVSLMGYPWQTMVFIGRHTQPHPLVKGHFGFDLPTTYAIWLGVVLLLYPLCTKWNSFKARNKGKWWLSYVSKNVSLISAGILTNPKHRSFNGFPHPPPCSHTQLPPRPRSLGLRRAKPNL